MDTTRCWRRQVSAVTLPELFLWDGCKLTAKEILEIWHNLIVLVPSTARQGRRKGLARRGGSAEVRKTRTEEHAFMKSQAVDFFKAKGFEVKSPEDMRRAWEALGEVLAKATFVVRNFDQILRLPVASQYDDKDRMWWRCQTHPNLQILPSL